MEKSMPKTMIISFVLILFDKKNAILWKVLVSSLDFMYLPYGLQNDVWKNCIIQKITWMNSKYWNGKYSCERWSRTGKTLWVKAVWEDLSNSENEAIDVWVDVILELSKYFLSFIFK